MVFFLLLQLTTVVALKAIAAATNKVLIFFIFEVLNY
jgi:hypothetical protein